MPANKPADKPTVFVVHNVGSMEELEHFPGCGWLAWHNDLYTPGPAVFITELAQIDQHFESFAKIKVGRTERREHGTDHSSVSDAGWRRQNHC